MAKTIPEQIEEIEEVLRKTPHHKATNGFIGFMRAKIARLKDKEMSTSSKGGGGGGGYAVKKHGDATVALIGPPSAGKSTLINKITNTNSKVADYAFTTLSVIPGMMDYNDAKIQILDIPGLIEGAALGKGRGKEVIAVARNSDLLVVITDPKRMEFLRKLVDELENAGIRINKTKPQVFIEKKNSGGLTIRSNIKQEFDDETAKKIASEFGVKNGEVTVKEKITTNQLIDSFSERIVYKPAIFVVNKSDTIKDKKYEDLIYISAQNDENISEFKQAVWNSLNLVKVYLVGRDEEPSLDNPVIMKQGKTLQDLANSIGTEFAEGKKLAKVWGNGARFGGQELPLSTKLVEGMQIKFI